MRTAIISVTTRGAELGQRIRAHYASSEIVCYEKEGKGSGKEALYFDKVSQIIGDLFTSCDRILCIMATGIVIRVIAPYIQHKSKDPAIIVMDERGQFAISLLSGHLGGANEWAQELAACVEAIPVITTATDVNGLPAPDVLARKLRLQVDDFSALVKTNAAIVAGKEVPYYGDDDLFLLEDYHKKAKEEGITLLSLQAALAAMEWKEADIRVVITDKILDLPGITLYLRPKTMIIGVGCRRDTPEEMIEEAVMTSLANLKRSPLSVFSLASVDVKADEKGLLAFAEHHKFPIVFYGAEEMAKFIEAQGLVESNFVKNTIGVGNVCETTSLLRAKSQKLLQQKTIYPRTTVAVAEANLSLSELDQAMPKK